MSGNVFIPKMNQGESTEPVVEKEAVNKPAAPNKSDGASNTLQRVAQYAVVFLLALTPIFFTPGLWSSLGFDKVIMVLGLGAIAVIAMSLLALRREQMSTVLPISLGIFWVLVMVAMVSGLHSGDIQDAMRGSVFETQTVGFLAILGLVMTISLSLQGSKLMTIKALALFGGVASLLLLYNALRIIVGPELLQFSSFGAVTVSPIGSFNDLAIFAGLVVLLGLVTLVQLPLKGWLQSVVAGLIALSLFVLAVVNFFNIWIVVGFFSLLMFVYLMSRDTLFQNVNPVVENTRILTVTTAVVCVVSAIFIIAGDYAGAKVSQLTNVDYV
jgi:hypothetical protein